MHKLLVTGGAGHFGEALMRTLRATGQQVIGTDLRSPTAWAIGVKGYHGQNFADGLYPVEEQ